MTPITCPQCGGLSAYCIRPDRLFECPECGDLLDHRDIDLDGSDVWAVNADGTLCIVTDPAASLEALMDAIEEFLTADMCANAEYARLCSMNSATEALAAYIDARRAGIKAPSLGYTEDQVRDAVNECADLVLKSISLGEAEEDAINLAVNAAIHCLIKPGSSFAEMVEENYGETVEEIRSWWGWDK